MSAADRIGVLDYGMGNLRSVLNALAEIGADAALFAEPREATAFGKIVIPGVGAFGDAMETLRRRGLVEALRGVVAEQKPLLGICLGMQLICSRSEEGGDHEGLGFIDADVTLLPGGPGLKVPHMGWNSLSFVGDHPILEGVAPNADAYFVHSYRVACRRRSDVVCETTHGVAFASVVNRGSVYGMQFHPEKSQGIGLRLLRNFAAL